MNQKKRIKENNWNKQKSINEKNKQTIYELKHKKKRKTT